MIRDARDRWIRAAVKLLGRDHGAESQSDVRDPSDPSFELRDPFLTGQEGDFCQRLCAALGERAIVCPKARASDVLRIPDAPRRLEDAVRLDRKFIDFLICDRPSLHPICAVQLDRWIENAGKYQLRDDYLEHALQAAGLAILHLPSDHLPTVDAIRKQFDGLCSGEADLSFCEARDVPGRHPR